MLLILIFWVLVINQAPSSSPLCFFTCLQSLNPMHQDFPKTGDLKGDQAQQFKCRKKGTSRKSRQKAKQCKARQDADELHSNNTAIEEPSKVEDNTTSEIDIITRDIENNNQDTDAMEVVQESDENVHVESKKSGKQYKTPPHPTTLKNMLAIRA